MINFMKYNELLRLLNENGWTIIRQSGGHIIMANPGKKGKIIIPFHTGKEVKKGLLKSILKQTGIKTDKR
jgi:predicted RNA binding protein YcfA (HicA-like mRNA interferase family)